MIRWLVENVGLMLLALFFAVLVWIAAEWENDPILVDEFEHAFTVQVRSLPHNTHLVEGELDKVYVRLRAARSVWEQLGPDQFQVFINLSPANQGPLEPGLYQVPVEVLTELDEVVVLGVEPTWLEVELEAIQERTAPVVVQVLGEPQFGYRADEAQVISDTVQVRGPVSLLQQVSQLKASVVLQGDEKETVKKNVPLAPYDAAGGRVSGVTLDPERVLVHVPLRRLFNYRELIVDVDVQGAPAPDYHFVAMSVEPEVVRVIGSVSILDDLSGIIATHPISIEGRTEDVIERLPLILEPGISTVYPSTPVVQVTVDIEPDQGQVTLTRTLTFHGLQPNLAALASPEVVEVILSGPLPRLSALLPDDVPVILDLSDMRLGDVEQLVPEVLQPEGITVDSIIPSIVQVEIARKSLPTREPGPTQEPGE
jgi:YbbR domain-containing protein